MGELRELIHLYLTEWDYVRAKDVLRPGYSLSEVETVLAAMLHSRVIVEVSMGVYARGHGGQR